MQCVFFCAFFFPTQFGKLGSSRRSTTDGSNPMFCLFVSLLFDIQLYGQYGICTSIFLLVSIE